MRLEYDLAAGPNFDDDAAEHMTNQVLASRVVRNSGSSYCAGVIKDGKMVLTPITSICQFRPDFKHIDRAKEARAELGRQMENNGEEGEEGKVEGDEPKAAQMVTVKVLAKERTRNQRSTEKEAMKKKYEEEEREEWVPLDWYDQDSVESSDVYTMHILGQNSAWKNRSLHFQQTADQFLTALSGTSGDGEEGDSGGAPTAASLQRMPLDQQVETLLRYYIIMTFDSIKSKLSPNFRKSITDGQLIRVLEQFAWLVRGNWVLQSELVRTLGMRDILVRSVFLCVMDTKASLDANYFSRATKSSVEDLCTIVTGVGQLQADGQFILRMPEDRQFMTAFPEVHAKLTAEMTARRQEIIRQLQELDKAAADGSVDKATQAKMETELKNLLSAHPMRLADLKRGAQKVCSAHTVSDEELRVALQKTGAIEVRGFWTMAKRGDEYDVYRAVLISMWRTFEGATKKTIIDEIESVTGKKCTLTDFLLRKLIREFAENLQGQYIFRGDPVGDMMNVG